MILPHQQLRTAAPPTLTHGVFAAAFSAAALFVFLFRVFVGYPVVSKYAATRDRTTDRPIAEVLHGQVQPAEL